MMTLYEIDARLAAILDFDGEYVDTESGEIVSIEDIEALQMAREDKIEGWGLWIKNKTAELDAIKAEAKKLTERASALSNRIEASKNRYQQYLAGEKVNTPRLSVSYRKTQAVEITDASLLHPDYLRTKTIVEADKATIKDAIKAGLEVPGAVLVERQSMTIK